MSIIKDGKTYRTLEEQVYYLTKEQAKDEVDIQSNRTDIISLGTQLENKQDKLTFDDVPTDNSNNPVKSNGIYDALATKQNTLTFDNTPTDGSNNPVKSDGIYDALATKEGKLTTTSVPDRSISRAIGFDSSGLLGKRNVSGSITNGGTNIVTSGGVYTALQDKQNTLTTSSVNDGTLVKAIGFDSSNNLVKGTVSSTPEGTSIKSTGVTSGYVLTADGTGGASWQASGGGGGGGGTAVYLHRIEGCVLINVEGADIKFWLSCSFYNSTSTAYTTFSDVVDAMITLGYVVDTDNMLPTKACQGQLWAIRNNAITILGGLCGLIYPGYGTFIGGYNVHGSSGEGTVEPTFGIVATQSSGCFIRDDVITLMQ